MGGEDRLKILTDKQYKNYERVSRYQVFPLYFNNIDKKYIYGLTSNLDDKETSFVVHSVKRGDTLDSLALYYYGNPTYYWIIADFNRIRDPFMSISDRKTIKIPNFSNIHYIG